MGVCNYAAIAAQRDSDSKYLGKSGLGAGSGDHRPAGRADRVFKEAGNRVSKIEQKLAELGHTLPEVATPAGSYLPAMISGNLVFTAGQIPLIDGKLMATGKLGKEIETAHGAEIAERCALNALAAIKSVLGDLDRIKQVVKVVGFVSSVPEFSAQPSVINGASEFLQQVFGDAGKHARSAVGVSVLPLDAPVEVELIVEFV